MNVIVCGTRKVQEDPYKTRLFAALSDLQSYGPLYRVIQGECPDSPDMWAKEWCEENHVYCESRPADWEAHGRSAGHIRNAIMAEYAAESPGAAYCIAVWNGKSNGTLSMIKEAVLKGIGVQIIPATVK